MNEKLGQLAKYLIDGEEEETLKIVRDLLQDGLDPTQIIEEGLAIGIRKVGELFEEGEYFLPELMQGAEIMKSAMAILDPIILTNSISHKKEKVVIGTVSGDIHDIGKTLVASMLTASGYDVIDLGADVSAHSFIAAIKEHDANILCLSALLTTTMQGQGDIIKAIINDGLRDKLLIFVGGAPVNASFANEIGADGYADNAVNAVKMIDRKVRG